MNNLFIKYFKAFGENERESDGFHKLEIGNKSLLLYGENGAGKSSIFEAIKFVFFQQKIENEATRFIATDEEKRRAKDDLLQSYNNKRTNFNFELQIDNTNYLSFDKSDYQVFMLSPESTSNHSEILLEDLIENSFFDIGDANEFLKQKETAEQKENYQKVEEIVNRTLQEYFKEKIEISIEFGDGFKCAIKDNSRNLNQNAELKNYFNEAKLNLILLLLHFAVIQVATKPDKKKLLVLDDFITSLDAGNRTFLVRYILQTFGDDYKKMIFTHNTSFYNLVLFVVKEVAKVESKWTYYNIYEINNSHRLYSKLDKEPVSKIKKDFQANNTNDAAHIAFIGNRIRTKFEILLHEFSKLMHIGAIEESKAVLDLLLGNKPIYLKTDNHKTYTACDLIKEIDEMIGSNLNADIRSKINEYKQNDYNNLKEILRELKLYQKVTMHPMSHATIDSATFTVNEIRASLDLLGKLETQLKNFVDKDVVTV